MKGIWKWIEMEREVEMGRDKEGGERCSKMYMGMKKDRKGGR